MKLDRRGGGRQCAERREGKLSLDQTRLPIQRVISRVGEIGTRLATARLAGAEVCMGSPEAAQGEEVKDMKVKTNLKAGGGSLPSGTGTSGSRY
jgi:hypothetical protein